MKQTKTIIAWVVLVILITLLLILNYIKFFARGNPNIEEKKVENSSSVAIQKALTDIKNNFNTSASVKELEEQNIRLSATLKNYSLFISYSTDEGSTTYEFNYNNLLLSINVDNDEENIQKFHTIYKILVEACQKRLNNIGNIDKQINDFFNDVAEWDGITKVAREDITTYVMNITKKIEVTTQESNNTN